DVLRVLYDLRREVFAEARRAEQMILHIAILRVVELMAEGLVCIARKPRRRNRKIVRVDFFNAKIEDMCAAGNDLWAWVGEVINRLIPLRQQIESAGALDAQMEVPTNHRERIADMLLDRIEKFVVDPGNA